MSARAKPVVVIGMLGPTLDSGEGPARWNRWRPTVALCQDPALVVSRMELLFDPKFTTLADLVTRDLKQVSPETEVRQTKLSVKDPWDFEEVYGALHDFARGYRFEPEREDYLVHITTGTHVVQICLFLLAESRHLPARLIQTGPPTRKTPAPSGSRTVIDLNLGRYDRLASRFRAETTEALSFLKNGIVTKNAHYNGLMDEMEHVALRTRAPMLLLGPTGAGKSQLAVRIHQLKRARNLVAGDLVHVNCATLRGDHAMATLFGHTRGAFTGAAQAREGLLLRANDGVLFLDEIGELGLDEQAMLLRALEEKVFFPVGADREVRSDFLLIAGTNRDLHEAVAAGRFRADLLARINLWTFELPGLAARPEDLAPNLDFETERAAAAVGTQATWSREARERYLAFGTSAEADWPGNFRDLNASITRLVTLAEGGRITTALVEAELKRLRLLWRKPMRGDGLEAMKLDAFDRVQLAEVVRVCAQSRSISEAGRKLFAHSRTKKRSTNDADRLRKYLARFDLTFEGLGSRLMRIMGLVVLCATMASAQTRAEGTVIAGAAALFPVDGLGAQTAFDVLLERGFSSSLSVSARLVAQVFANTTGAFGFQDLSSSVRVQFRLPSWDSTAVYLELYPFDGRRVRPSFDFANAWGQPVHAPPAGRQHLQAVRLLGFGRERLQREHQNHPPESRWLHRRRLLPRAADFQDVSDGRSFDRATEARALEPHLPIVSRAGSGPARTA